MQGFAVQTVIDHFAQLEQLAVPEVDELFAEGALHMVPEDFVEPAEQVVFAFGEEQVERALVHVDDLDFRDAARDEFRVDIHEDREIGDAPRFKFIY